MVRNNKSSFLCSLVWLWYFLITVHPVTTVTQPISCGPVTGNKLRHSDTAITSMLVITGALDELTICDVGTII